jgi:DNA-binding IclR family transcriptional regulator
MRAGAVTKSDERPFPAADPPSILSKAFDVLRAFGSGNRVMTLSEIARASGLPKSTVHRLIARLVDLGAIEPHRSGYVVSVQLFSLATSSPAGGMREAGLFAMAALHRWSGQTVQLAVLRQFDVVLLEQVRAPGAPALPWALGILVPANCLALGKALLSYEYLDDLEAFLPRPMPRLTRQSVTDVEQLIRSLAEARQRGIAHDVEEAQPGLASSAVPIVIRGHAVGALGITHAVEEGLTPQLEHALLETAAQIARACSQDLQRGKTHYFPYDL